ncbi:MAG: YraN family protein [Methylotetracoccus sp.]|nr:YraN family protein [Methylotetracoccus sp.]
MTALGSERRTEHLKKGRDAEDRVLSFLERQGLRCLTRNFRSRYGEIDLVMDERGTVVFVEVRYRGASRYGGPLESIDARKRARLTATAQWYLCSQRITGPARFDVVGVEPLANETCNFVWIKDAIQDR